jgi:hypothetical protein
MHKAAIHENGAISLGAQARSAGFRPGVVVEVILTGAGSLILAISDDHDAVDVPFSKPLPRREQQLALRQKSAR